MNFDEKDLLYLKNINNLKINNNISNLENYKLYNYEKIITNNIEESVQNSNDEYIIQLLIQYLKYRNADINTIISYLISNKMCNLESLIKIYPEFGDYVQLCDKLREYYLYHLMKEKIDVDNQNTYEINKGEFDTASTNQTTIISKYAGTLNLYDGILYKINGKVYRISEKGFLSEIQEGSTIIIHNPYNIKDVLYVLEVLAGTENKVVLGTWGFNELKKEQLQLQKNYLKIIDLLSDKTKTTELISDKTMEFDGINCNSFVVNTKNLIEVIPFTELLSKREIDLLRSVAEYIEYYVDKDETKNNRKVKK